MCRPLTEDKMQKILRAAANRAVEGNTWTKFTKPTVNRGKTVFPKTEADLEKFGVRWDYDGDVERSKTTLSWLMCL